MPTSSRREQVEARNATEAMVHSVERSLAEHGDKMPAGDKGEVESALAAGKAALEGTDAEALKSAHDRLSQAAMKIGEAAYKAQGDAAGAAGMGAQPGPEAQAPGGDRVVDAEFEEVDERKKAS